MTENPVVASATAGAGAVVLPATGGNTVLTAVAIAAIVVGVGVLLSIGVRAFAKRVYKA